MIPDWVAVMPEVAVSVTVTDCVPAVSNVTVKTMHAPDRRS